MSPTRLCIEPRCPNSVRPGASKCDKHEREYERERSRRRRGGLKRRPLQHRAPRRPPTSGISCPPGWDAGSRERRRHSCFSFLHRDEKQVQLNPPSSAQPLSLLPQCDSDAPGRALVIGPRWSVGVADQGVGCVTAGSSGFFRARTSWVPQRSTDVRRHPDAGAGHRPRCFRTSRSRRTPPSRFRRAVEQVRSTRSVFAPSGAEAFFRSRGRRRGSGASNVGEPLSGSPRHPTELCSAGQGRMEPCPFHRGNSPTPKMPHGSERNRHVRFKR